MLVDRTIGAYDPQLGVYVESSSHLRQIYKERGLTDCGSLREIKENNAKVARDNRQKSETRLIEAIERAKYYADRNDSRR
jgi:hypothetical protein